MIVVACITCLYYLFVLLIFNLFCQVDIIDMVLGRVLACADFQFSLRNRSIKSYF